MFFHQSPPAPLAIATRAKIARLPGPDQPRQKWNRQRKAARNAFRSDHQLIDCFFCGGCLLPSAGLYGWRMNNSRRRISKVSPFALAWSGDDDCNIMRFWNCLVSLCSEPISPVPSVSHTPISSPSVSSLFRQSSSVCGILEGQLNSVHSTHAQNQ